jgi:hypothetical protein
MLEEALGFGERRIMSRRRICYYFVQIMFAAITVGIVLAFKVG